VIGGKKAHLLACFEPADEEAVLAAGLLPLDLLSLLLEELLEVDSFLAACL
jgi:hypothetical protein